MGSTGLRASRSARKRLTLAVALISDVDLEIQVRQATIQSCVHLGVALLRKEATELDAIWANQDVCIEELVAPLAARDVSPYPSDNILAECKEGTTRMHTQRKISGTKEIAALRPQAENWERRLASGAWMQEDPNDERSRGEELPSESREQLLRQVDQASVPGGPDVTSAHQGTHTRRRMDIAAVRKVRENDPSPGPTTQRQWAYCNRRAFRSGVTQHQKKAHDMKNKANALELELRTLLSSASVQVPEPVRES
ncbi:UNVERIFIED_CONTAM: KRUF family protein [Hammondia hammondi]|eukprot:XP_008888327.1 KRUF family protein [Hammondia hammondi]